MAAVLKVLILKNNFCKKVLLLFPQNLQLSKEGALRYVWFFAHVRTYIYLHICMYFCILSMHTWLMMICTFICICSTYCYYSTYCTGQPKREMWCNSGIINWRNEQCSQDDNRLLSCSASAQEHAPGHIKAVLAACPQGEDHMANGQATWGGSGVAGGGQGMVTEAYTQSTTAGDWTVSPW